MLNSIIIALSLICSLYVNSQTVPSDPQFFANEAIQKQSPYAFAVQAESIPFLKLQRQLLRQDVLKLVSSIRADLVLNAAIVQFPKLNLDQKTDVLKRVFAHQVNSLKITPPELVLDNSFKNNTFFDFDPTKPSAGRVILNPKGLSSMANPYAPLLYLIHETKHSAQFQIAFSKRNVAASSLENGFRAAFLAQQSLKGKLSFCDFLTLVNEHDAFQYGNAVIGILTGGASDDATMGTFASQFQKNGLPKIDLIALFENVGPLNFITSFNRLEVEQWKIIKQKR